MNGNEIRVVGERNPEDPWDVVGADVVMTGQVFLHT